MWNKPHLLNALSDLLMLVAAATLLGAGAVWLLRVPSLPVREVVFQEELPHTRRQEIEQILPATLKGNFFSVNLENVRAVLETLPWVRRAEVRRVWPAKLEVRIEEHQPAARWGEGRGEMVNSHGEVFSAPLAAAEQLPLPALAGPVGTAPEVLRRYGEFVEAFRPLGEKPVQVSLSPRLAWQLKLANGMVVDIGREQAKAPLAQRLQRFVEIYPETVARQAQRPAVVDLRYPSGFAMRSAEAGKGK